MGIQQLLDGPVEPLRAVRQEWLGHGLAARPADRDEAERGVVEAYRAAGLEAPRHFVWLGSPMAGAIASWLLSGGLLDGPDDRFWGDVRDRMLTELGDRAAYEGGELVRNRIRDQVRHEVRLRIRDRLWELAEALVRSRVPGRVSNHEWYLVRGKILRRFWVEVQKGLWEQVQLHVRNQVQGQIETGFQDRIGEDAWTRVRARVLCAVAGQHEADWFVYDDFFGNRSGVAEVGRLGGLMRVARSAGWWWPHRDVVVLTERPTALCRDLENRLHCESGPALVYPDGFAVWAWHGIRVRRGRLEAGWDPATIMGDPDTRTRGHAVEYLGWDRFIRDAGWTPVASCPDPQNPPHQLELYDLPPGLLEVYGPRRLVMGVARDSGKRYGLLISSRHTDPVAAAYRPHTPP